MKTGIIEAATEFYRRISIYLWTTILFFLSVLIVLPDLADLVIPGFTDRLFGTRYVYLIFFLFFIDLMQILGSIKQKIDHQEKEIVFENQTAILSQVFKVIQMNRIRHAKMIEVSCRTARPILISLIEHNCESIDILLQHPDYSTDPEQGKRIRTALEQDKTLWLSTPKLHARLYKFQPTIRGRLLDSRWLNVGWFTPVREPAKGSGHAKREVDGRIAGHLNPMLLVEKGMREGDVLISHFNNTFNTLSSGDFSIPVSEYYSALPLPT